MCSVRCIWANFIDISENFVKKNECQIFHSKSTEASGLFNKIETPSYIRREKVQQRDERARKRKQAIQTLNKHYYAYDYAFSLVVCLLISFSFLAFANNKHIENDGIYHKLLVQREIIFIGENNAHRTNNKQHHSF